MYIYIYIYTYYMHRRGHHGGWGGVVNSNCVVNISYSHGRFPGQPTTILQNVGMSKSRSVGCTVHQNRKDSKTMESDSIVVNTTRSGA